jgi:hypothetical protein
MSILDEGQFAYVIRGGRPIQGTLVPGGNKNAALPMLAATLLAEGTVELSNVPQIRDAAVMLELLAELGAGIERLGPHEWRIDASTVEGRPVPGKLASLARFWPDSARPSFRAPAATESADGRSTLTCTHFKRSGPKSRSVRTVTG